MAKSNLTLIIPAYNEEANVPVFIPKLMSFIKENDFKAIIINDGSTDRTKDLLTKYIEKEKVKVLHNKVNHGYGGALKRGIEESETEYVIMMDADGQHYFEDVLNLYNKIVSADADMIIGSRKGQKTGSNFRRFGKWLIRVFARMLMPIHVHDLNSGMKIFRTDLGKKYLHLYPDTMAFSDILALVFINNRHLVLEEPIRIRERITGKSTIRINTAFQTVMEILNILILFNPLKIFLPLSIISIIVGLFLGVRYYITNGGISIGSSFMLMTGVIIILLGLVAEQLSKIRKRL